MQYNPYELLYMSHFDESAQVALFHQYSPLIRTIALTCTGKYLPLRDYLDDLIQEGRITLFQAAETYRNDQKASFLTYLTVILKRRMWAECRRIYSRITANGTQVLRLDGMISEDETYYGSIPQTDPFCDPVYYTEYVSALERLREVYRTMSREETQIVECWINRERYADAAGKMNMSIKTYESRLAKVRRRIRDAVYDGSAGGQ